MDSAFSDMRVSRLLEISANVDLRSEVGYCHIVLLTVLSIYHSMWTHRVCIQRIAPQVYNLTNDNLPADQVWMTQQIVIEQNKGALGGSIILTCLAD